MSYQLQNNGYVVRLSDGAWVPPAADNADWQIYQDWLAAGNVAEAADPLPVMPQILTGPTLLGRLNDAEYSAILQAAQLDVTIMRWLDLLRMHGSINLSDQTVLAAKAKLVSDNLITADRAAVIFAPA